MSSEVDILRYRNSELEVALRRLTAEMDARQCRQCADLEGRLSKACDTLVNYQAGYRDQCEKLAEARAEIERLQELLRDNTAPGSAERYETES